jgi:nucleoid DNA-binding protein
MDTGKRNKNDMSKALMLAVGVTKEKATEIVDYIFYNYIPSELSKGSKVAVHGFGVFKTKKSKHKAGLRFGVVAKTDSVSKPFWMIRFSASHLFKAKVSDALNREDEVGPNILDENLKDDHKPTYGSPYGFKPEVGNIDGVNLGPGRDKEVT